MEDNNTQEELSLLHKQMEMLQQTVDNQNKDIETILRLLDRLIDKTARSNVHVY